MTHETNTNKPGSQPGKRGRGRPSTSGKFRVVPVPREQLDLAALGRAFLALALHETNQREAEPDRPAAKDPNDGSA